MKKITYFLGLSLCCFMLLCLNNISTAHESQQVTSNRCEQFIIAANDTWRPFVEKTKKGHMNGFVVDLVEMMLHELDLPYRYSKSFHGHDMAKIGVRFGSLDMILMNKRPNEQYDFIEFVRPAYADDATVVAVNSMLTPNLDDWHQLMGLIGLNAHPYFFNSKLKQIKDNYLFVDTAPTIDMALDSLRLGDVNFVMDSRARILAKSQAKSLGDVFILPDSHYEEPLYLALAKHSPCSNYMPFFKKRLLQLKEQGILTEMLLASYYPNLHVLGSDDPEYK